MKSFLLITAALICLAGVQGLSLVRRQTCNDFMEACAVPLIAFGETFNNNEMAAELANDTVIDAMCSHLNAFTTCAAGPNEDCAEIEGLEAVLQGTIEIIGFMCSAEGRALLREIAQSPCATDHSLVFELQQEFESCFQSFEYQMTMVMVEAIQENDNNPMARICPLVDGMRLCNIEGARSICGNAFATFVEHVWDTFSSIVMAERGLDCTYQVNYARRAVGLMKRHLLKK